MKALLSIFTVLVAISTQGYRIFESRDRGPEMDSHVITSPSQCDTTSMPYDSVLSNIFNDFSFEFFKTARIYQEPNYVVSPLGVGLNLSILSNGAKGETKKQILEVLGLKNNASTLAETNDFLSRQISFIHRNGSIFETSYWVKEGVRIKPKFMNICDKYYHTPFFERDLATEETRLEINQWVEERTKGMIKNFLEFTLDEKQYALLLNTIYIRAKWDSPYNTTDTQRRRFNNLDGTQGLCNMMRKYNETLEVKNFTDFSIYRFPLDTARFSIDIILPHKDISLDKCVSQLNADTLSKLKSSAVKIRYDEIMIPKWEVATKHYYDSTLKKMGIECLFNPWANLSGITNTRPFFIDRILQKAKFIIDERGAEAAAATCDILVSADFEHPRKRSILVIDRPFLYLLTDRRTDTIIFIGEIRQAPA